MNCFIRGCNRRQLLQTFTFTFLYSKNLEEYIFVYIYIYIYIYTYIPNYLPIILLQIPQWAHLSHEGRERVVGLNFNISELSESLMRDSAVSLVNGRIQLMLTGADEEDFYGLNNLFLFIELVVD